MRAANPPVDRAGGSALDRPEQRVGASVRVWSIYEATSADAGVIASCIDALAEELVAAKGEGPLALEHGATSQRTAVYLQSRAYRAFIARWGCDVIGVITVSTAGGHGAPGPCGWIEECFVAPAWRGCGVGSDLVGRARAAARERGCHRLHVNCPPLAGFAGTRRFYEREGFRMTGPRTLTLSL